MNETTALNRKSVVVVGAGPGGYAAAFYAADMGMDVTLIDPATNPGGVCLYRGCIPSKALLHVSKLLRESEESAVMGVRFAPPEIDVDQLREWKDGVVSRLTGGLGGLTKQRKIDYRRGMASLVNASTLRVEPVEGESYELAFENLILATGSHVAWLPHAPTGSDRFLDSTGALELADVPPKLLVVGGGYIGLELGSVYSALGSRVTVVEMMDSLIPGADKDLVRPLAKRLKGQLAEIKLSTKVTGFEEREHDVVVSFENTKKGGTTSDTFDKVLISIGRKPNSAHVGLENTSVVVDDQGFVQVDPQMRTSESNIFAIGDLVGQPMLAHKASHEAKVAVDAINGLKTIFDARAIPAVVFTDPEVAWAGLMEDEAKAAGKEFDVAKFPWAASGRAMSLERTEGLTKLVVEKETERILGVGVVGAGAGELIAEGVLAIEMGATATDLGLTIHPHPTLSETVMEAAELFKGHCTHIYRPKRS